MLRYDSTLYQGTVAYYLQGRPPYSRELAATLVAEVGLRETDRLLDVGCGPGSLVLELAPHVAQVVALDPDAEMLVAGERRVRAAGIDNVVWIQARGEDLATLGIAPCNLATFGQSFHWMDRERVADLVYDLLEPGGAIAIIGHQVDGRPQPAGPGYPAIPHARVRALIDTYLGPRQRAGQGFAAWPDEPLETLFARTRFGVPQRLFAPGRADIVRSVDEVLANYFSMSYAAPHLFGERLGEFTAAVRADLSAHSPAGLFWDWPGDTEVVIVRKPG
jgi:SAM-dependent methyltransferase